MSETSIKWSLENHVVLTKAYNWDAAALTHDINMVNNMVKQSNLPLVHTLWDFTELETYPTNLNSIRKAVQPLFTNQQLGWVITVINNPMITFLAQVASSMYGVRYHSVNSMDKAIDYLAQRDSTLTL